MANKNITRNIKLIVIILAFILACLIPFFFSSPYYMDLFIILIVNGILSMSFIMLLRTGLISLGISAMWGIGAYISPVLVMKLGVSFWVALPGTALLTGLVAFLLGFILMVAAAADSHLLFCRR